jgi:hypothetical protein
MFMSSIKTDLMPQKACAYANLDFVPHEIFS